MWQRIKNIYHLIQALLANIYYGWPGKDLKLIGITGTDGKTTTTHLIYEILKTAGKKTAFISSVYAKIGDKTFDTGFHVTSPDPHLIPKYLRMAKDEACEYVIMEVTSHGLDQKRFWGQKFAIGVLTNITHEHLDYHRSYKQYLRSKRKLLLGSDTMVVNEDDASFQKLKLPQNKRLVTYGLTGKSQVNPLNFPFTTTLPGKYNQYNSLAAIAVGKHLGIKSDQIRKAIKNFTGVAGRFEEIKNAKGLRVIIDFAHTPNAFVQVLSTVKATTAGRLIHVFGSAGLRDFTKRPLMGEISAKFAKFIVLTEEDYRTESLDKILNQLAGGCSKAQAVEFSITNYPSAKKAKMPVFFKVKDRQEAINFALQKLARKKDTVLITGKAHEKSLCRGKIEYPWNEFAAVKEALK